VISFWDSLEGIKGLAWEGIGKAVFYPKDREFLVRMEQNARHYDIAFRSCAGDVAGLAPG